MSAIAFRHRPRCQVGGDAPNDEPPAVGAAQGFKGQAKSDDAIVAQAPDERKEFETMRARAALARCTLHQLSSGGYLLCMGGLAREVPDLRQVGAVLAQMGPRP